MDFYLWRTVKKTIYQTQIDTREELMQRIRDVFAVIK